MENLKENESKDIGVLLSIIISTYNRKELVVGNISKMLECNRRDIEFIVGDNASSDGTFEELSKIKDDRISLYENKENMGALNVIKLRAHVSGRYFVSVNDRDFFPPNIIDKICNTLTKIKGCDAIVFSGSRFIKNGYYGWKKFIKFYFWCNHPGNIVYRTDFIRNNMDRKAIKKMIDQGDIRGVNIFLIELYCYKLRKCFYYRGLGPVQPKNRDLIKQTRKDLYGSVYILPEYHYKAIDDRIGLCAKNAGNVRSRYLARQIYINSLYKVTTEFRRSVSRPMFCERNGISGIDKKKWIKNGWRVTGYTLQHHYIKSENMKKVILLTYLQYSFLDFIRVAMERTGTFNEG